MRTARQILEYYFIQISGYEGQTLADRIMKRKDDFLEIAPDGTEKRETQHLMTGWTTWKIQKALNKLGILSSSYST